MKQNHCSMGHRSWFERKGLHNDKIAYVYMQWEIMLCHWNSFFPNRLFTSHTIQYSIVIMWFHFFLPDVTHRKTSTQAEHTWYYELTKAPHTLLPGHLLWVRYIPRNMRVTLCCGVRQFSPFSLGSSVALGKSHNCPRACEATVKDSCKCIAWTHNS